MRTVREAAATHHATHQATDAAVMHTVAHTHENLGALPSTSGQFMQ